MGQRGPKPTPTRILKLKGSWRANLNRDEPEAPDGCPSCPTWLDAEGKRCWAQETRSLKAMGLLKKSGEVVHHETHMAGRSVWERTESLQLPGDEVEGIKEALSGAAKLAGVPGPQFGAGSTAPSEPIRNEPVQTAKLYEEVGILPDGSLLLRGEAGLLFQAKLIETVVAN